MESPSAVLEDVRFAVAYLRKKGYQVSAELKGENLCGEYQSTDTTHSSVTSAVTAHTQARGLPYVPRVRASIPNTRPVYAPASGLFMCVWATRMNELELVKPGIQGPGPV